MSVIPISTSVVHSHRHLVLWFNGRYGPIRLKLRHNHWRKLADERLEAANRYLERSRLSVDRLKEIIQKDFYAAPMGGCTERLAKAVRDEIVSGAKPLIKDSPNAENK